MSLSSTPIPQTDLRSHRRLGVLAVTLLWTLLVGASLAWTLWQMHDMPERLAVVEAKAHLNKDLAFRRWSSKYGGLYIAVTPDTPPNPYLAHLPERDIETPGGRKLTLYNPATILRHIMQEQDSLYGIKARITSERYLNPVNAPDEWERRALRKVMETGLDFSEITDIRGKSYLRVMQPMIMEEGCLKCHAGTDTPVGGVGGGTDVSIPLDPYFGLLGESRRAALISHGAVWCAGLAALGFITVRRRRTLEQEVRVQAQLRKLNAAVEQGASAVLITDAAGTIEYVNHKFVETNGYGPEEAVGRTPRILKADGNDPAVYQDLWRAIKDGQEWRGELINRRKSGETYWCAIVISPIKDEQGRITHFVGVQDDVSERKTTEETIRQLAFYDPLTELPNRRLMRERLEHCMALAKRSGGQVALLYLDLDRFKFINDTLGHQVGDGLLRAVAVRFADCLRESDTLARLGGDEFAVIVSTGRRAESVVEVAEKLLEAASRHFNVEGHELYVTASIGISLYPMDTESADLLLRNADLAMYHAKAGGKNVYQFYSRQMNLVAEERLAIENGLRRAVEQGEMLLEYQPKLNLASGRVYGMEALLRWQHPDLGTIPPDKFVPVAEENGEIIPLGAWVLTQACFQTEEWRRQGLDLVVSVNLSAVQFRLRGLAGLIQATLHQSGLPGENLELEITESALLENAEDAARILKDLEELGVSVSIDDFGTGHSSLAYLKRFKVSTLKIDRSFVRDVDSNEDDRAIANSVIALARSMALDVIAEGVETETQAHVLRLLGCQNIQGYFLSRPLPPAEFADFVNRHRSERAGIRRRG
jgi:diguanylate cyclase (GGDEF)-like protein/PAS domain S-box-containing protein